MITIGIPVYQGVDLLDITGPHEIFSWMNDPPPAPPTVGIQLIADKKNDKSITTRDGFTFTAPTTFEDASKLDVLWVPGGAPDALNRELAEGTYIDFLKQQSGAKYICSVCEGAILLAASGLLDNHLVTTHWRFVPCLSKFNVKVAEGFPRFVLDGNRLTGGGISSGLDEAFKLVELLTDYATAQDIQQTTQYYPCPPVASELTPATDCLLWK
jgi:transcriptional regulator GlxA family with amidase domain